MPETFNPILDFDVPSLEYRDQPVNQAHVNQLERENRKLADKLDYLTDPTKRKPFEIPSLAVGYQEHSTDDTGVKKVGAELTKRLSYVEKQIDSHQIQMVAFLDSVARRATNEQDHEKALIAAVEAGKDAPAPIVHDDLSGSHAELNRLESAITTGARLAHETRDVLELEYQRLYRTESYRVWANKEIEQRNKDAAKAAALLREALSARDAVINKLPNAFADPDGVAFVEPVKLGRGGMDPNVIAGSAAEFTTGDALAKLESVTIPGDGIRKWSVSQLTEDEKQDYARRAAQAKMEVANV
ncbi:MULTISPECIES: hypothetical protein [unclassified Streptomyces]|uniref:hypothetical protein n=1 Tax=unclassified Streptomyces TaxID=2593676 RepID=UPI002E80E473|nr:hypothetical protein [Streptomyces sp. NBC_00569]WUB95146.1 hypothetical protein OHO83_24105 [Streptomyces sp. NBC_00569]